MAKSKPYEVGYGKPPKAGQWKKGQSGNPSGKKACVKEPPPQTFLECLAAQLDETVEMTVQGKKLHMSIGQALAKKLLHDLMAAPVKEKLKALESLLKLGVFDLQALLLQDDPYEDCFTEEDRRILAAIAGHDED